MTTPLMPVTALAETIVAGRPEQFEEAVRAACEDGADRETLLMSVDVARGRAHLSAGIAAHAYAVVHRWGWIMARRKVDQRTSILQAA